MLGPDIGLNVENLSFWMKENEDKNQLQMQEEASEKKGGPFLFFS